MNSVILRTATKLLLPLLLVFSAFVLLRGHDEPGGGFIGGLLSAGALAAYSLAWGPGEARKILRIDPRTLVGLGLLFVVTAAFAGPVAGGSVLEGLWAPGPVPGLGKVSTVLLFDLGVHLAVLGATLAILLTLAED